MALRTRKPPSENAPVFVMLGRLRLPSRGKGRRPNPDDTLTMRLSGTARSAAKVGGTATSQTQHLPPLGVQLPGQGMTQTARMARDDGELHDPGGPLRGAQQSPAPRWP